MIPVVFTEYRNQHASRSYPFEDTATLTDTAGSVIPVDFIVDAFMYPLDLVNSLYLSALDTGAGTLTFADTVTGDVHGTATFDSTAEIAYIYEPTHSRQIGILTFGPGLAAVASGVQPRIFTAAATALAPSAFVPLNQAGVRGLVVEDVTAPLVTGALLIEGKDGATVTSRTDSGQRLLRFDFRGSTPPTDDDCVDICPLIQTIQVVREAGSLFDVAQLEAEVLALYGHEITLDDVCEHERGQSLPAQDDGALPPTGDEPCLPAPGAGPAADPGAEVTLTFTVADMEGGAFHIVTPANLEGRNLFKTEALSQYGGPGAPRIGNIKTTKGVYSKDVDDRIEKFRNPAWPADGLVISMRATNFNRGKQWSQ